MSDHGRRKPHNRDVDPAVIVSVWGFNRGIRRYMGEPAPWPAGAPHTIENFLAGEPVRLPDGRITRLDPDQALDNYIRAMATVIPEDQRPVTEVGLIADQVRRMT